MSKVGVSEVPLFTEFVVIVLMNNFLSCVNCVPLGSRLEVVNYAKNG